MGVAMPSFCALLVHDLGEGILAAGMCSARATLASFRDDDDAAQQV